MRHTCIYLLLAVFLLFTGSCQKNKTNQSSVKKPLDTSIFALDNLAAWCVVPFDKLHRTPSERAEMLAELGFTKFVYDWRDQHLPSFPQEVSALREHNIELLAVWWWIDGQTEDLLNQSNRQLLGYLDSLQLSCDIWMSFDERFFEGLEDSEKLQKATDAILVLHREAASVDARLHLYNHGSWFGDPRNQVRLIETSGLTDMGIIYNFHHGHHQIDSFPQLLDSMLPYLNTVNINGMNPDGPKILTVGEGTSEKDLLITLASSDFNGHIGIIGHLEEEDVKQVLARNINGLQSLVAQF